MSRFTANETRTQPGMHQEFAPSHRRRPIRVLFVHRVAETIDSCLQALEKGQFNVTSDSALSVADCAERLHIQPYDLMVIEYPSPTCRGPQDLQLLHQSIPGMPIIFLTSDLGNEIIAELTAEGPFDYVETEHLAQLPMAVRRLLKEKKLHEELEDAKKALRHSQSLYRALSDNPAYGIYRCDAEGILLDANSTLAAMLGYATKEQLLEANQAVEIIPNFHRGSLFAGLVPESMNIEPVEIECKRKDGTALKARLSGRGVYDDQGNFAGHEVIAVDVTEQRTLEQQLRHEAASDSLTGLANHRRLFEVLHAEICRSRRTGREFSLLLLDLDGLKKINDRFGHQSGSRALCRLGQILADCSRSVDTAARHGGDEFAVVLPETGFAAATLVAHRICDLLKKDLEEPLLSVSVGVANYPRDADTIGTLLYAADRALYQMKEHQAKPENASQIF